MESEPERSHLETRPQIPSPRPAPYWSSCGHRNVAVAWTRALTPLLRPPRRSALPAPRVRSMTDAAPGGSPDPRPGCEEVAESEIRRGGKSAPSARRKETLTGWRSPSAWMSQPHPRALHPAHPARRHPRILLFLSHSFGRSRARAGPGSVPPPPTHLTKRSMTARSAWCQARSSVSWSDCSRNSWPGIVRIWVDGGEKAWVSTKSREAEKETGAGNWGCTLGSGKAWEMLGRALTCRTLRRLDRWRPWARAAPRRSTLLSGRLPAGPWQSGEKLRPRLGFAHCLPLA